MDNNIKIYDLLKILNDQDKEYILNKNMNHTQIVEYLINNNKIVNENYKSIIALNCVYGYYEIVKYLFNYFPIEAEIALKFLTINTSKNDDKYLFTKSLLDLGADIHFENDIALINSVKNNDYNLVHLLINYGADIHAQNDEALIYAASNSCYDIVKLLLEAGANVNAQNDRAIFQSTNYDIIFELLQYGAIIKLGTFINSVVTNKYDIFELFLEYSLNSEYINKLVDHLIRFNKFDNLNKISNILSKYYIHIQINT
ncbi:MAG: hypothetical protein Satyrvirus8_7 [Satyrvirus sp.]|uniref:Uncharacterized protein n=1 Tax=Satyrvirus sp. TaxID=2487771 RepID=A0A3G5AIL2_9VIRU|nr:MAG: hypothetical protein Satyrvirus8_7 [Satyrvirus sp.]